jgi:hypothetical protein
MSMVPTFCQPSAADQNESEFELVNVPSNAAAVDELLAALESAELELLAILELASLLDDELGSLLELLLSELAELGVLLARLEEVSITTELSAELATMLLELEVATALDTELASTLATELALLEVATAELVELELLTLLELMVGALLLLLLLPPQLLNAVITATARVRSLNIFILSVNDWFFRFLAALLIFIGQDGHG